MSFNSLVFASKAWFLLLIVMLLLALSAAWLSYMPLDLAAVSTTLIITYAIYQGYDYWTKRVVWLSLNDQTWQWRLRNGQAHSGQLVLSVSFVSQFCSILALRSPQRRRLFYVLVFYDALPNRELYRRLRALLRVAPSPK